MASDFLFSLLAAERPVAIVDVGANPIDGSPPYQCLLDRGICRLVGFEPLESAVKILDECAAKNRRYLPCAVGDGEEHTFYVCDAEGMSSLLKPDVERLRMFNLFPGFGNVIRTERLKTRKLDEIEEVDAIDFLKIDIQGSELSVFQSGRKKLRDCVLIQTEVSFQPLYEDQPMFWEILEELRGRVFNSTLSKTPSVGRWLHWS